MGTYIKEVQITDDFRNQVIEVLGYPVVDSETIFDMYNKEHIDNHIIASCLEKFFNYFPKIIELDIQVSKGVILIDAPTNTLGIAHYSLVNTPTAISNADLNNKGAFFTASQVINSSFHSYGTPFRYGETSYSAYQKKFFNDSINKLNGGNQFYAKFKEETNQLEIKANSQGVMHLKIGCWSSNIEDIAINKRQKFLELCQATLGLKFAKILKLTNGDLPLEIDADTLLDESKEKLEQIEEWLSQNSQFPLIRG